MGAQKKSKNGGLQKRAGNHRRRRRRRRVSTPTADIGGLIPNWRSIGPSLIPAGLKVDLWLRCRVLSALALAVALVFVCVCVCVVVCVCVCVCVCGGIRGPGVSA